MVCISEKDRGIVNEPNACEWFLFNSFARRWLVSYEFAMPDQTATLEELKQSVAAFAEERDWIQYHSLKNLAMSISIEAGELMELFQWSDNAASNTLVGDAAARLAIEDELADVLIYSLQFANRAEIDLSQAIKRKMAINADKYPVEKARGRSDKYDSL